MKGNSKNIMIENVGFTDINPLIVGEEVCGPQHSFGPASREYYLLHYVFQGEGSFYTKKGEYQVTAGQIFIVHPFENTTYIADERNPWHYAWVGFELSNEFAHFLEDDVISLPRAKSIFKELINCELESGREWFVCSKIFELFSLLKCQDTEKNRTEQYVCLAKNFIHSNYVQELRVEGLADNLGLDRSYFSQIFKKYTGKSPQQYIVDYRLEKAANLLHDQKLTPGEAARQVGYNDIFNFSRMFRRRYGVPPSRYKANK